jgi:hypothetical protein
MYFDWIKQNLDSINLETSVGLFNNVVTLLNYLTQANIEDKFADLDINHLILPEEIHLQGMTVFSKSKKYYGDYNANMCIKNEVKKFIKLDIFNKGV